MYLDYLFFLKLLISCIYSFLYQTEIKFNAYFLISIKSCKYRPDCNFLKIKFHFVSGTPRTDLLKRKYRFARTQRSKPTAVIVSCFIKSHNEFCIKMKLDWLSVNIQVLCNKIKFIFEIFTNNRIFFST